MTTYTEVTFLIDPVQPWRDILAVELAELGFDSFDETYTDPSGTSGELKAYIPADRFDAAALPGLLTLRDPHVSVNWTAQEIAPVNWNAKWESDFKPVEVGKEVRIRADFHDPVPGFTHEIVITPRMAFGTGHHATTRMMIQAMLRLAEARREGGLEMDLAGKDVCDMGCGTGVLAILAHRMGASPVIGYDIDPGAVDNARDNMERNGCTGIAVDIGTMERLERDRHDLILANIERNVLLDGMQRLHDALRSGGVVLLSGFVPGDRHMLVQRARAVGLEPVVRMQEGDWALLGCRKNT